MPPATPHSFAPPNADVGRPAAVQTKVVADFVVVGSGLTGATIARLLTDAGREVVVLERRGHVGGNVHDHVHASGVRIHTYGPHYFRTNAERIWAYATRFDDFHPYEATLLSRVDGRHEHWPVTAEYIRRTIGDTWTPAFTGTPTNFEDASLAMMPAPVFDKFVRGYTEKQWGVPVTQLDAELARRFDVRHDGDVRLMRHRWQGIPVRGYAAWTRAMLDGIPVITGFDYLEHREAVRARRTLVFTGPIDAFYDHAYGRLAYRGQRRIHTHHPDVLGFLQPAGQVNHPSVADGPQIRTLEWKHMMPPAERNGIRGTVVTQEIPESPSDADRFEYPFPDARNRALYRAYRAKADEESGVLICGRLGEYRYYDMDQAIARAMLLAQQLLAASRSVAA